MIFRRAILAATLATMAGAAVPAVAQESNWQFAITPRFQYSFLNFNASGQQNRFESATIPFYGDTVEVVPPGLRNWSFLLTVMDGSDYGGAFTQIASGQRIGTYEIHRRDIEALIRYRLEGTGVSLFGGFRYISQRVRTTLDAPGFVFFNTGSPLFDNKIDFYLAELGGGYAHPLTPSGEHSLFGNLVVGLGKSRATTNAINDVPFNLFVVTFDANAGYNWQFASCCALQARYRAFVFPAGNRTFKDLAVQHGPELGLTVRFSVH
jgi:hypothetical protein